MLQVAAKEAVAAGEAVSTACRLLQGAFDGGLQFRRNELVGIQAQHPIVLGCLHGELLLRAEAEPGLGDDAGAAAFGQGLRAIRAARIDNDDFVGEMHALQAGFQLRGGVEGDDRDGERLARGGHL